MNVRRTFMWVIVTQLVLAFGSSVMAAQKIVVYCPSPNSDLAVERKDTR